MIERDNGTEIAYDIYECGDDGCCDLKRIAAFVSGNHAENIITIRQACDRERGKTADCIVVYRGESPY